MAAPRNNAAWVTPDAGGLLRSTDDRVLRLRVPSGAVEGRVRFTYRPQSTVPNPPPGLRFAFRGGGVAEDGRARPSFAAPLRLSWAARPHEALGAGERLSLVYDETTQQWQRLPTRPTRGAARQAQAATAQVTLFAAVASSSFVPEVMPSIRGVQSDLFTGSASSHLPHCPPAGPWSLTPELALRINSRSRYGDPGNSSVLGTGWKLSADSFIGELWEYGVLQTYIWRIAGVAYTEAGNGSTGWYFKKRRSGASSSPVTPGTPMRRTARAHPFEPALHRGRTPAAPISISSSGSCNTCAIHWATRSTTSMTAPCR